MPEINSQSPVSDPKFILPQRRSWVKYIMIPIIVILVLACAAILYIQFSKPTATPAPVPAPVKEDVKVKSGTSFYLATESDGDSSVERATRLYQYSADSATQDVQILETKEKFFDVLTKYNQPYTYIAKNATNKFFILDANAGKIDLLFELAEDPMVREVAVSEDKTMMAYARNFEGSENGKSGGSIWTYNFETKTQKEIVKKTELGLYQGFSVLGWRDNDKELIVSGLGGDAGATWGDIYQVNIATGAMVKVMPVAEKNQMEFLRGTLSPNGDKWLYTHCEQPDEVAREKEGEFNGGACISGTELRTYDFGTKDIKTVYKNLRYENNNDKNILRVVMDYKWESNTNIIASVPGAILAITIGKDVAEEIYLFDRYVPQNFKNNYLQLRNVNKNQLVFNDGENWKIFDRNSDKLVELNRDNKKETIIHWLD